MKPSSKVVHDGIADYEKGWPRGTAACKVAQPISSHQFRSSRRHAKRVQQESHIQSLEAQLRDWWSWWLWNAKSCAGEVDHEVLLRLRAIEPGIRAQVISQPQGEPHHSSRLLVDMSTHDLGCGAKHYFPSKSFEHITASEVKANRRRKAASDMAVAVEMNIFALLEGMVTRSSNHTMGATLISVPTPYVPEEHDGQNCGESLVNLLHARREKSDSLIDSVVAQCACENWKVHVNDIVYIG